jgi:hypothetical protein
MSAAKRRQSESGPSRRSSVAAGERGDEPKRYWLAPGGVAELDSTDVIRRTGRLTHIATIGLPNSLAERATTEHDQAFKISLLHANTRDGRGYYWPAPAVDVAFDSALVIIGDTFAPPRMPAAPEKRAGDLHLHPGAVAVPIGHELWYGVGTECVPRQFNLPEGCPGDLFGIRAVVDPTDPDHVRVQVLNACEEPILIEGSPYEPAE